MSCDDQFEICEECEGRGWIEGFKHMHTPNGLEEVWGQVTCDFCDGEGIIDLGDGY